MFEPLVRALARVLIALRVTPTAVTWGALALEGAGATLIATGSLVGGAAVWGLGAALDALDGTVARLTGRVTKVGGFLDSLLDRYGDATILIGIGWHYDTPWIWAACMATLLGATATSYAKARTYQDVRPPADGWPDLLERPERAFILGLAVGFQGFSDAGTWPSALQGAFLPVVVATLAVLTNLTVVQRARRAISYLRQAEAP